MLEPFVRFFQGRGLKVYLRRWIRVRVRIQELGSGLGLGLGLELGVGLELTLILTPNMASNPNPDPNPNSASQTYLPATTVSFLSPEFVKLKYAHIVFSLLYFRATIC